MIELNDKIAEHEVELAKLKKQREASQKANPKPKEGTIISTSTKEGFSWSCEASGELIVKHTAKTIETAFISLNKNGDSELDKLMLAIAIMEEMSKVAKSEGVK